MTKKENQLIDKIINCIDDKNVSDNLKVAALTAYINLKNVQHEKVNAVNKKRTLELVRLCAAKDCGCKIQSTQQISVKRVRAKK